MRSIVLTAACALGLAFATLGGASAAPLASGLDGVNVSPIEKAQTIVVTPGRRYDRWRGPRCERITRCRVGPYGRRVCRTERICRR